MKELITLNDLLEIFSISRDTYNRLTNKSSDIYDPDFPIPVPNFSTQKNYYSMKDVDRYSGILMERVEEERKNLLTA